MDERRGRGPGAVVRRQRADRVAAVGVVVGGPLRVEEAVAVEVVAATIFRSFTGGDAPVMSALTLGHGTLHPAWHRAGLLPLRPRGAEAGHDRVHEVHYDDPGSTNCRPSAAIRCKRTGHHRMPASVHRLSENANRRSCPCMGGIRSPVEALLAAIIREHYAVTRALYAAGCIGNFGQQISHHIIPIATCPYSIIRVRSRERPAELTIRAIRRETLR